MNNIAELSFPEHFFLYEGMKLLLLIDLLHYSTLAYKAGWKNLPSEIYIDFAQMQAELKVSHPAYRASLKRLVKAKLLTKMAKHKYIIVNFRDVAGELGGIPDEVC